MARDSFLDTCIIISYSLYSKKIKNKNNTKCYGFVKNKKAKFLVCYFSIKELGNFISSRRIINYEIINKLKNPAYEIGSSDVSRKLNKTNLNKAKQIYEKLKNNPIKKTAKKLILELMNLEMGIEKFLKFKVDEKVIPIEEINRELSYILYELMHNYNDCRILASAIQEQEKCPLVFVTIDKEHFNTNTYEFLKGDRRLKKYKFPELRNLLYEVKTA